MKAGSERLFHQPPSALYNQSINRLGLLTPRLTYVIMSGVDGSTLNLDCVSHSQGTVFIYCQKQKVGWFMLPEFPPKIKPTTRKRQKRRSVTSSWWANWRPELTSPWWTCVGLSCPSARPSVRTEADLDVDRPRQTVPSLKELQTRRRGSITVESLLW